MITASSFGSPRQSGTMTLARIRSAAAEFTDCPYEDLRAPGRVHVDPSGNVHLCQGILCGNLFKTALAQILESYDPAAHPVVGPILADGPVELARRHAVPHRAKYADACHLCFETRRTLRPRFPSELGPDQAYGTAL